MRPAEGHRLVEIAEEEAHKKRQDETQLLVTLFEGVMKSQIALAQLIARRPTL